MAESRPAAPTSQGQSAPTPAADADSGGNPTPEQIVKMSAEDREKVMARSRGVSEDELETLREKTKWYVSNRGDDRVVLWERDPRHPGGEVLFGGGSPRRAYTTRAVEEALYGLLLVECPAPLEFIKGEDGQEYRNRKYPQEITADPAIVTAAQPGQAIPLGRSLDPELWDASARQEFAKKVASLPKDIPVPRQTIIGGV